MHDLPGVRAALKYIREGLPAKYPEMAARYPEVLPYHGARHAEDVLAEAMRLAAAEGVGDPRELELLAVAAAWHDAGFVVRYEANEPAGADAAAEWMRRVTAGDAASGERGAASYSEAEIARVRDIILSTRVEMDKGFIQLIVDPSDPLQRIIADADVANFGRPDAAEKSELVWQEMTGLGRLRDDAETRKKFDEFRERIVAAHEWQTAAARRLLGRDPMAA